MTKKKLEDPIPWLSPDVLEQLIQYKKTSKGFLKRSKQAMLEKKLLDQKLGVVILWDQYLLLNSKAFGM